MAVPVCVCDPVVVPVLDAVVEVEAVTVGVPVNDGLTVCVPLPVLPAVWLGVADQVPVRLDVMV